MNIVDYVQHLNCYLGFLSHADSYDIRKAIWESIPESRKKYIYGGTNLLKVKLKDEVKHNIQLRSDAKNEKEFGSFDFDGNLERIDTPKFRILHQQRYLYNQTYK